MNQENKVPTETTGMSRRLFIGIGVLVLLPLLIFMSALFLPRTYPVPRSEKRASTRYWELSTGSTIGYTLCEGKGAKKPFPVVFLQGGPGGAVYDRNIETLSSLTDDGFDVYLYDQAGCGFSARLGSIEEYTVDRHTRDLEEIVKKTGAAKVILIGQSWGAILAAFFMAGHPGMVEKVILTGPGPLYPLHRELANLKPPDSLRLKTPVASNAEANRKAGNIRTGFVAWAARTFGVKLAPDREMDDFQTFLSGFNKATVCDTSKAPKAEAGGGFYAQVMTMKSLDVVEDPRLRLKGLTIPVLVMKGQCDNQKWGYLTEYLELFPVHRLVVIPGAGHSISIEQPGLYIETIRNFLIK